MGLSGNERLRRILPFAAGGSAVLLVLLVLLSSRQGRREDAVPPGSVPEAVPADSPTRSEALRHGVDIERYWDSLEGIPGDGNDPGGTLPEENAAPVPAQGIPERPAVEDLFGPWNPPVPAPAPVPPPPAPVPPANTAAEEKRDSAAQEPAPLPPPVRRSGSVSSLDLDVGAEPGSGFSTQDGSEMWADTTPGRPYRCVFIRSGRIHDGQRVTVRLLEDLVSDGVHIPANTHLTGVAALGARLDLSFSAVDLGGRIVRLGFAAWDTDGERGIYCPDTGDGLRDAADRGAATAAGLLSPLLGRIARETVSAGTDLARKHTSSRAVTIPAGYTFYIMKEDR